MYNIKLESYVPEPDPATSDRIVAAHYYAAWKYGAAEVHEGFYDLAKDFPDRTPLMGYYDEETGEYDPEGNYALLYEYPEQYLTEDGKLDDTVAQAVQATRASYRLAAPVFDPTDGRTKLLVPLCLVEDGEADCALVLDLQPSGAYRAAAILPLARAYACARVISREQPDWLAARRVL